ncbi:hypothetical protein [Amycolatopsis sp. CA-128772]|uniref:hypothetical protein n=1 Tax=Amycolatopsis sp. CA-128772 TaxID=2073159 RepID=UPI000CD09F67|nr:hypothetical protein [Amycolatopsis sp. CA-128772]
MRSWIIDTARDLLDKPLPGGPLTLEEIAACSGIKSHHLRAYFNSVETITADMSNTANPAHAGRC